jgi:hypothetical protein
LIVLQPKFLGKESQNNTSKNQLASQSLLDELGLHNSEILKNDEKIEKFIVT